MKKIMMVLVMMMMVVASFAVEAVGMKKVVTKDETTLVVTVDEKEFVFRQGPENLFPNAIVKADLEKVLEGVTIENELLFWKTIEDFTTYDNEPLEQRYIKNGPKVKKQL